MQLHGCLTQFKEIMKNPFKTIYKKLLRDYYAGLAMQADISRMRNQAETSEESAFSSSWEIAQRSYEMADDMLKERNDPAEKKAKKMEGVDITIGNNYNEYDEYR